MSSRLALDGYGRLVVELTVSTEAGEPGTRFLVLGNTLEVAGPGIGFLGVSSGRTANANERMPPAREGRVSAVRQSWPTEVRERALELRASGWSCSRVAAEVGAPTSTVKFWAQRAKAEA